LAIAGLIRLQSQIRGAGDAFEQELKNLDMASSCGYVPAPSVEPVSANEKTMRDSLG
jgi:hypothetical protein